MKKRRERLEGAVGDLADDINREEYLQAIEDVLDGPPYGKHVGWWAQHKHPLDRAAESEERRIRVQRRRAR